MTDIETAADIEAAAASWVLRLDQAKGDPEVKAQLEAWLGQDARRHGAWLKAEAAWAMLDQMPWPETRERDPRIPVTSRRRILAGTDRRALLFGGIGAMGLAGLGGLWGLSVAQAQTYTTAIGEIRKIPLDDGAIVNINTDSRISVSLHNTQRQVRLETGEAWFDIAKAAHRPFWVEAGALRIRAVETAFSVRHMTAGAEVLVTDGVIDAYSHGRSAGHRVSAGEKAFVSTDGTMAITPLGLEQIERTLAWRNGNIDLSGITLSEAVDEFNRYNARTLVISDPALSRQKLYGVFHANDPEAFARAVQVGLGTTVIIGEHRIELGKRTT